MDRNYLKQRRRELGLTMEEVAQKVGVTRATISRWESGHIEHMKTSHISKLANVLDISPLYIVGATDEPQYVTTQPPEINEYVEKAYKDPEDKRSRFMAELIELRDMYEKGLLTEEEFQQGKKFIFEMTK